MTCFEFWRILPSRVSLKIWNLDHAVQFRSIRINSVNDSAYIAKGPSRKDVRGQGEREGQPKDGRRTKLRHLCSDSDVIALQHRFSILRSNVTPKGPLNGYRLPLVMRWDSFLTIGLFGSIFSPGNLNTYTHMHCRTMFYFEYRVNLFFKKPDNCGCPECRVYPGHRDI